jgi:hypothetical protein
MKQQSYPKETRRWALLVYIAGENNLSDAGLEDIKEMCKEGASSDIHVGVEFDTIGELTGSIRYEITERRKGESTAYRTVIERLPEKDSGDPTALLDFLKWGLKRYPAENRLLVVWGHGSGFRSISRDIGYDDFGSSLNMPEIETAFKRAGINSKNKLQIVGFDACLMNMLEVVHHFRKQVEVIVGSQQSEPGDGWPYDLVLKQAKNSQTKEDLGCGIVQVYLKEYRRIGVTNVTQSAIRTADTEAVVKTVHNLGKVLLKNMNRIRDDIRTVRIQAQTFEMADYVDIIHLAELINSNINDQKIRSAADKVIKATGKCIMLSDKHGSAVSSAHGLSLWFPASASLYFNYRSKYMELSCNHRGRAGFGWTKFLDAYHS